MAELISQPLKACGYLWTSCHLLDINHYYQSREDSTLNHCANSFIGEEYGGMKVKQISDTLNVTDLALE